MDKLLAEHRRRFQDFEAVDVMDGSAIDALRQRLAIHTRRLEARRFHSCLYGNI
jgi:hypothetical protein